MSISLHAPTKKVKLTTGVRQGVTIFLKLFITVSEHTFKILNWKHKGINITGKSNFRSTYDMGLISSD